MTTGAAAVDQTEFDSLPATLRRLRRQSGLSQADLADRVTRFGLTNVSQALVSQWERGDARPSKTLLALIATALQLDSPAVQRLAAVAGVDLEREQVTAQVHGALTRALDASSERESDQRVIVKDVLARLRAALAFVEAGTSSSSGDWNRAEEALGPPQVRTLDEHIQLRRAQIAYNLGDFEKSEELLRVLAVSGDYEVAAAAHGLSGLIKLRLGEFEPAEAELASSEEALVRINRNDYTVMLQRAWARKRYGQLRVASGNLEPAIEALKDALARFVAVETIEARARAEGRQGQIATHFLLGWAYQIDAQRQLINTRRIELSEMSAELALKHHLAGLGLAQQEHNRWKYMQGLLYLAEDCHKLRFMKTEPLKTVGQEFGFRIPDEEDRTLSLLRYSQLMLSRKLATEALEWSVEHDDAISRGRIHLALAKIAMKQAAFDDVGARTLFLAEASAQLEKAASAERLISLPRSDQEPNRARRYWGERLAFVWATMSEYLEFTQQWTDCAAYAVAAFHTLRPISRRTPEGWAREDLHAQLGALGARCETASRHSGREIELLAAGAWKILERDEPFTNDDLRSVVADLRAAAREYRPLSGFRRMRRTPAQK